jgi:hypothetical protein
MEYVGTLQFRDRVLNHRQHVVEHTSCHVEADWELDYKLKSAVITMQPGNLEVLAIPQLQAGHRIIGPENRATGYPRILCSVKAKDGRKGVGMLEFFFVFVT